MGEYVPNNFIIQILIDNTNNAIPKHLITWQNDENMESKPR